MRWRGSILLLLVAGVAWGQETPKPSFTVFVRENNSSGRPLAGVQISAKGANGGPTGADGRKTLVIPGHQPGDDLEVAVYKEGYEVVNDLERNVTLPRKQELHLFLCKPAGCLAERLSFYRLSADPLRREIEARYQKSLKELAERGLETAKELGRSESERDQALATVDRLTEELAQLKPGEGSSSYRRAVQLFTEGKLEDALQELDAAKLDQARNQARSQLEDVTQRYILRGRILAAQFRSTEAEAAFEQAVATSPNSLDAAFALASFLTERKQFAKASEAYERSLNLARAQRNPRWMVIFLTNLSGLHHTQNRLEEARKAIEEAVEIVRQLAAESPEIYQPEVAMLLNILGSRYRDQSEMVAAQTAYEEALECYRQSTAPKSELHLLGEAETLDNLGDLRRGQNRMEYAQKAYEEALANYRQLAAQKPEIYLHNLAGTLTTLGDLYRAQKMEKDAQQAYEEASASYRQLAAQKPKVYLFFVARAHENLGDLYSGQNRIPAARKAYVEALASYRQLTAQKSETYLPDFDMARNLQALRSGQIWKEADLKTDAKAGLIRRHFATINPEVFLHFLAQTLESLGELEVKDCEFEAASALFTEALVTRKQLVSLGQPQNPTKFARTAAVIAVLYAKVGKTAEAVPAAQEALSLIETLDAAERNSLAPMVEELRKIVAADPAVAPEPADPQSEPQGDDRDAGSGGGFVPPAAEQRPPKSVGVW